MSTVQGAPAGEAARRARQQATVVASLAAVVPTVLAAQGMAALAMDVLGFSLIAAVALAGFLELALISSALLARASALAGRPGGADAAAVWAVSAVSGLLAGAHEFVGPETGGVRSWESDPSSLLAAGVRVAAPLVAAWLWERVLTAARREHAERTLVEVRRDRRLLAVARAALVVRRLEEAGRIRAGRGRWVRRRLDRAHIAALRVVPPGADLPAVLAAVGAVDLLPAGTAVGHLRAGAPGREVRPAGRDAAAGRDTLAVPDTGQVPRIVDDVRDDEEDPPGGGTHVDDARPSRPGGTPAETLPSESASSPSGRDISERDTADERELVGTSASPARPALVRDGGGTDGTTGRPRTVVRVAELATREAAIVALAARGLSQRAIAEQVGVSKSTVSRILQTTAQAPVSERPAALAAGVGQR
ncbi:helix-turn-helix domain-containing protein [Cellulomonas sp. 179-A 4D5 NHS]|uniref:helix-turn-helix domain-containing protein n=1 Tax=Cellulomonas sp. 179-A 4D5 NHS TaxID=3142378 RepID=UPI00399FE5AF